ncbi:MAG: X-Pro dipeptidyl-peptidase, partial [Planctomyces sp.]
MQMESADGQPLSGGTADRLEGASETGFDQYTSDPDKPVPYSQEFTNRLTNEFISGDQRFAARRPDVLVYQTDVLAEDVVIAGPLVAQFFASTSGTDADFVV